MSETSARTLNTVFHADLSNAHPGEDYWVSVAGSRIPLVPHTPASLKAAHDAAPYLKAGRTDSTLTHYAAERIALAADSIVRVHLRHSLKTFDNPKFETGVSLSALYIPPSDQDLRAMADGATFHAPPIDHVSTAQTFLFHHPDLMTKDKSLGKRIIDDHMAGDKSIRALINVLASTMRDMGEPTEDGGWATLVPYTPPDTGPIECPDGKGGIVIKPGFDGKKTYCKQEISDNLLPLALNALAPLLIAVQNDPTFKDKKWVVKPGASVEQSAPARSPAAAAGGVGAVGDWNAAVANTSAIHGLTTSIKVLDAKKRQVEIMMSNEFIRYLGGYIRFYDASGDPIKVRDWKPDDAGIAHRLVADIAGLQYDDVRYLGHLSPINSFLGVPIDTDPGVQTFQATFPPNAVRASVYGSGLGIGSNPWPKTPVLGGTLTGVFNFGVPAFMLGFGVAALEYKPLIEIIKKLMASEAFIAALVVAGGVGVGHTAGSSAANKQMNWRAFVFMVDLIFSPVCTQALGWVMATVLSETVAEQIPFAGWCIMAINIAAGILQMGQTIIAVATSDWNIENQIATTITTDVTVHPDPRPKAFPPGKAHEERNLIVKMIYEDQARPTVQRTIAIPEGGATTFTASFPNNTLGGRVKFEADFFVGDWLAGKATTGLVPNDAAHVAAVTMYLINFPVPLDEKSIYAHARILTYKNGAYGWTDTAKAPVATIADRDAAPTGNALGDWTGLDLSQRTGILGASWQAAGMGIAECRGGGTGQLYAFMNFNIPGTSMTGTKFPSCGFTSRSRLIYDPYPPKFKMSNGNWDLDPKTQLPIPDPTDSTLGNYYVDPSSGGVPLLDGGGYHLRMVTLDDATPFNMAPDQKSFGRFAYFPDSVCLHPSGLIIGVSALYKKLQIVTLDRKGGRADRDVPLGAIGAGPAVDPTRPGLMFNPVAVACAYDGTIIVLEDTKSGKAETIVARLSAYDLQMKTVSRFFDRDGNPSCWLYLADAANSYYLDLAIVGDDKMSYIYVLYYTGSGAHPADYNMAIYTYGRTPPKTNPLVTTNAIAAAKLAVDMWHSAYTLNFAMVTDESGKPAGPKTANTGPAGRTVPSISMWLPPTPKKIA